MTSPTPPTVSVVVATLDNQRFLRDCLDGLVAQSGPSPLEVLVVDRGSSDATREVARAVPGPIRVLERPGASVAEAVEAATADAVGDLVVVAPARAVYREGALAALIRRRPALAPVGTTAFGRAAAAVIGRGTTAPPRGSARSCWFVGDEPAALARDALARPSGRGATLVAATAVLAVAGRGWFRVAVPVAHAAGVAARALRASGDPGVAPHRAFLACEIWAWCTGAAWWSQVRAAKR